MSTGSKSGSRAGKSFKGKVGKTRLQSIEQLIRDRDLVKAEDKARQLLLKTPSDSVALNALGHILIESGRAREGLELLIEAGKNKPSSSLLNDLGVAYRALGEKENAISSFRRAISIQPQNVEAHFNLADCKVFASRDDDFEAIKRLAERRLTLLDKSRAKFAYAKALDDLREVDASFKQLSDANKLKRQTYEYDVSMTERFVQQIKVAFSKHTLRARFVGQALRSPLLRIKTGLRSSGPDDYAPIFIVGMPRSGTTLVEQILASHGSIDAVGERNEFKDLVVRQLYPQEKPTSSVYPGAALTQSSAELLALGHRYLKAVTGTEHPTKRVVDKTPMNFLFIGLIRLIWPKAIVIHCTRDPIATCFSCYQKLFTGDQPFAYSLSELGRYWRLTSELMDHWQNTIPGMVHQVSYESLVENPEPHIRKMLKHCRLKWDPRCLDFHLTERTVLTASALQVRRPIYRTAVNRWESYAAHLGDLKNALGDSFNTE